MLSIETISQRLADAKGKRERLISTLNRHTAALEKKEREFEKTYKLKPELCSEESLRGSDRRSGITTRSNRKRAIFCP